MKARAAKDTMSTAPAIAPIAMPALAPLVSPCDCAAADAGLLSVATTVAGDTSGTVLVLGSALQQQSVLSAWGNSWSR